MMSMSWNVLSILMQCTSGLILTESIMQRTWRILWKGQHHTTDFCTPPWCSRPVAHGVVAPVSQAIVDLVFEESRELRVVCASHKMVIQQARKSYCCTMPPRGGHNEAVPPRTASSCLLPEMDLVWIVAPAKPCRVGEF